MGAGGYVREAGAKTHSPGKGRGRLGLRHPDRWLAHPRCSPELHPAFLWASGERCLVNARPVEGSIVQWDSLR